MNRAVQAMVAAFTRLMDKQRMGKLHTMADDLEDKLNTAGGFKANLRQRNPSGFSYAPGPETGPNFQNRVIGYADVGMMPVKIHWVGEVASGEMRAKVSQRQGGTMFWVDKDKLRNIQMVKR